MLKGLGSISRLGGTTLAIIGLTAALAGGAFAGTAHAAVGICRSDPVVVLSNLKTLDLSATIQDRSSDLNSVSYTLHLPAGVKPLLVVPTDGLVGQVEHFSYVNDQAANKYSDTTYASTGTTVTVTAAALNLLLGSASENGTSNEPITLTF